MDPVAKDPLPSHGCQGFEGSMHKSDAAVLAETTRLPPFGSIIQGDIHMPMFADVDDIVGIRDIDKGIFQHRISRGRKLEKNLEPLERFKDGFVPAGGRHFSRGGSKSDIKRKFKPPNFTYDFL